MKIENVENDQNQTEGVLRSKRFNNSMMRQMRNY